MRRVATKFQPTVVLQHPHGTDSPRIWLLPWRYLEKEFTATIKEWASGICFYYKKGKHQRSRLRKVLEKTRNPGGLEFVFATKGHKITGPDLL